MLADQNALLAFLPDPIRRHWKLRWSVVEFSKGQSRAVRSATEVVCFPITCVIGVGMKVGDGDVVFQRFIGKDFALGLVDMLDLADLAFTAIVVGSGYAISIPKSIVVASIDADWLRNYAISTAIQRLVKGNAQLGLCASSHRSSERLARLLLQSFDCFGVDRPVTMSQHEIAEWLMIRRETVGGILAGLESGGLIETYRGSIELRHREALQIRACRCYDMIEKSRDEEIALWKSIRWKDQIRKT